MGYDRMNHNDQPNRWYKRVQLPEWAKKWPYTGGQSATVTSGAIRVAMENVLREFFWGEGFSRQKRGKR